MHLLIVFGLFLTCVIAPMGETGTLPRVLKFTPELYSLIVALFVFLGGIRSKFRHVGAAYWLIFLLIALNMLLGVIVNGVGAGPIISGLRYYLRPMPMFLLPAVVALSEKQLGFIFRSVLAIALIQLPIATYQRLQPGVTGDGVYGTMAISSFLSMYLIACGTVVMAAYLRGRITLLLCVVLLAVVLLPTAMNETKGTFLLMPIGLIVAVAVASPPEKRMRYGAVSLAMIAAFIVTLGFIYNQTQRDAKYGFEIQSFFLEGRATSYIDQDKGFVGSNTEVGRGDALRNSWRFMVRDPLRLTFGLGIGNASRSQLGQGFAGRYGKFLAPYSILTVTRLLFETGIIGLLSVFVLLLLILRDAFWVAARDQRVWGYLAAAWCGVVLMALPAMAYKEIIASSALSYAFWFFSGVVCAARMQHSTGALPEKPIEA